MRRKKFRVRHYRDHKRPKLKFVVSGRENGRRARRFFTTKTEAESYAQAKNIELRNQGIEGAEFPSALRVMAKECADRLAEHKCTIRDATEHLLTYIAATKKSCTASELVEKLRAAKKADGASARYLQDLKNRLNRFALEFDGQLVATITTARLDEWLRGLNVSPVTRNNFRRLLIVAFNYAVQQGYTTQNSAEKTSKAKEKSGAPGILSVSETARLLENASPDVLPYIAVGAFAGLRRAEIERLDWSEVDFESGLIRIEAEKSKTAQKRLVQILPNLRQWLLPIRQLSGPVVGDQFSRRFVATRKAAGIHDWPDNALRHSFASYHLAHFQNSAKTALELGHHDAQVTFRHYRELVRPKEAERYWSIRPAATKKVVPMVAR
jgi:integrase